LATVSFVCFLPGIGINISFRPADAFRAFLATFFGALVSAAVVAQAARAEPDGYTLLMTLSSLAVLPEADRLFARPRAVRSLIWTRLNFLNSSRTTARG
jgi:hypothetical protein